MLKYCRTVILLIGLSLWGSKGHAQDFLDINWNELRIDSILPVFTHDIPLEANYEQYEHQIKIEFPEFEDITSTEVKQIKKLDVQLPDWPVIENFIGISAKKATLHTSLIPLVFRDGKYQRITSLKLNVIRKPRPTTRAAENTTDGRYATQSKLAQGKWVKIRIKETGIHRITHSELHSMGFSNPDHVRLYGHGGQMMAESYIQDCIDDLKEVPLYRRNNDVLFYAHGTISWKRTSDGFTHSQNTYSSYGYYFLTETEEVNPLAFSVQESDITGTKTDTYPDFLVHEKDEYSWLHRGRVFFETYDFNNGRTQEYTFKIPGIVPEENAKLRLAFGEGAGNATITTTINDKQVGTLRNASNLSSYTAFLTISGTLDCSGKLSENTKVKLTHSGTGSGHLDYITLNFTRKLALRGTSTIFRANSSGQKTFSIDNANASTIVWKISDNKAQGYAYTEIKGTLEGTAYKVNDIATLTDEYVVLDAASNNFPSVEYVGAIANQNLHGIEKTDMVIVVPTSAKWISQAQRLAELHRQHDSLHVTVVRADQIYNEFSSGTPDATAIRRFMKMFYDRAQSDKELPKYLLLFADCAADNRMITTEWKRNNPDDFLPCFQSELSSSETRSYIMEEYFCLLDDDEGTTWTKAKSDAAVGRLTVRSLEQATTIVDKIENYMFNREAGAWKNKVCIMGDDGDNNRHMEEADKIVERIQESNPNLVIEKIYWDAFKCENGSTGRRYPGVTQRIRELSAEGALMMYYTGHGRADELSHELAWGTKEMEALSSPRLPLWITAACDTSPIDLPEDNMGEAALLNKNAGAIAFLGATRSTYGSESNAMHKNFCKQLFSNGHTLGEALRQAKNETTLYSNTENNLHYVLIGDPALKLKTPDQYQVKITEINGEPADNGIKQFKTGSQVTLKGEIVNQQGERINTFNGLVYPSIYGSKQKVVCNGNDPEADFVYEFWDYSQEVYTGSDSVRAGEFTFTFPVPLDVNYSPENGNINFYALDNLRNEAQGSFTEFYLDGTVDNLQNDSIGPQIALFLNTTDFVSGDKVNETPLLMVALHDEDGINTTGNGIGHDLIAIIDNDPQKTYVLNSYYQSEPGDYTLGALTYSLPPLEPGIHTIMVRAWDILNNSSTVHATFEVVKGLRPALTNVWCTESPAHTATTFIVTHDRPMSNLSVKIEVFDFAGRILWTHSDSSVSTGFEHRIPWNLNTNSGQPVGTGVYLYRATISSAEGGGESTKARKIIVTRQ